MVYRPSFFLSDITKFLNGLNIKSIDSINQSPLPILNGFCSSFH